MEPATTRWPWRSRTTSSAGSARRVRRLGAAGVRRYGRDNALLYDIKSLFARDEVDARL